MSASSFPVDGDRLWRTLSELAEIGATPAGGVARVALTDEDLAGREQFVAWVRALGCSVHVDQMGNLFARREGTEPDRLPVVIGSHLDSQPTGGRYDGAYGVMVGLEILRVLAAGDVSHCGADRGRVVDERGGGALPAGDDRLRRLRGRVQPG